MYMHLRLKIARYQLANQNTFQEFIVIANMAFPQDVFREQISKKCLEYASERLKFSSFKELQTKAILSALKGRDVFVNLPTGYGKVVYLRRSPSGISLCVLTSAGMKQQQVPDLRLQPRLE